MPFIAVTTSLSPARESVPERITLNSAYLLALEAAGGTPLLLTPGMGKGQLGKLLELASGVMLTGGGDIDPARYNAARHSMTANVVDARDSLEIEVATRALDNEMPVFAICRGMQVVSVALGGSLHQHLPEAFPASAIEHAQTECGHARSELTHAVAIVSGSRLAEITGCSAVRVNSMHHQALDRLGAGLVVTGTSADGVVEAVEMPAYGSWFIGVQWHPEELAAGHREAAALFAAFVATCQ